MLGVHNDLLLFKRSESFGLRYTEYVSDGDNKDLTHLQQEKPYGPDVKIEKFECANHLAKRACNSLFQFGQFWKPEKNINIFTDTQTLTVIESDKDTAKNTQQAKNKNTAKAKKASTATNPKEIASSSIEPAKNI